MIHLVFLALSGVIAYTYAGYPLLLLTLSAIRPFRPRPQEWFPRVTVLIAAFNEEKSLPAKLCNIAGSHYPGDKLEILVVSDGSTDGTDQIASGSEIPQVRLLRVEGRQGKTAAQNAGVVAATGDIIVFTDATTDVSPDAIRHLVATLADARIGCAAGSLVYKSLDETITGRGGANYWSYEQFLRRKESRAAGLIGLSGCLYASRKAEYVPLAPDMISDFAVVLEARVRGLRTELVENALCYETTLETGRSEFLMRTRVIVRSLAALSRYRALLNPLRHGFFAIELLSHKALRYALPLLAMAGYALSWFDTGSVWARIVAFGGTAFFASAALGWSLARFRKAGGILNIPGYMLLANLAAIAATVQFLRGRRIITWTPERP